jgi:hypothetical protein
MWPQYNGYVTPKQLADYKLPNDNYALISQNYVGDKPMIYVPDPNVGVPKGPNPGSNPITFKQWQQKMNQ